MPRQLSHSVEQIARQAVGKDWGLYATLLDRWSEIVGPDYARVTSPAKVQFPHQPNEAQRRNGTLTIRLPKGLVMEFTYKTEQIRQRINSYFGYEAVAKIVFDPIFGIPPKPQTAPQTTLEVSGDDKEKLKSIENNELRDVLQALGGSIASSDSNLKNFD